MDSPDKKKRGGGIAGKLRQSRKLRIGLAVLGGCVLFYTIAGFFIAPFIAKSLLQSRLEKVLDRPVKIQSVRINPYTLSIAVTGLTIDDRYDEPFLSFDELSANLQLSSVVKGGPVLSEISLSGPTLSVSRTGSGAFNFSEFGGNGEHSEQQDENGEFRFSVGNIKVTGGTLRFVDHGKKTEHILSDVFLSVPQLSNLEEDTGTPVPITFTATLDGSPVLLSAECLPFAASRQARVSLDVMGLDVSRYILYFDLPMNIHVRSCYLDAGLESSLVWEQEKAPEWSLTGHLGLGDVDIADPQGNRLLEIPLLETKLGASEPLAGRFHVEKLSLDAPEVRIQRAKDGEIDLASVLPSRSDETPEGRKDESATPFDLQLDEIQLTAGRLLVSDFVPSKPVDVTVSKLDLEAKNITTRSGDTGSVLLRFQVNERGSVTLEGKTGLSPFNADMRLSVEGMDIRPFEAYIEDMYRIDVTSGHIEVDGRITFVPPESMEPMFRFKGEASVLDLVTLDRANAQELLSWENLYVSDTDFTYGPERVSVGSVALTGLYAHVIVSPEAELNVLTIFGNESGGEAAGEREEAEERPDSEKDSQTPVNIGQITLQGGRIRFLDRHVHPNFEADMRELGGRVSALSSESREPSDVHLEGKLENYAPLEIKGTLSPWGKQQVANLNVQFSNIELGPFSPYSEKYLGRAVRKGKLSLNLAYEVSEKTLSGSNRLFLNQFTLGREVASPDATTLPVDFAIALLKDRDGNIQLEFPVSGDFNDPQFSLGHVVLKLIQNLFTKIISSPFAAIGAAMEGEGKQAFVDFKPGSAEIGAEAAGQLDSLAKALYEHPDVTLEIQGDVAPEKDRDAHRQDRFDDLLRAEKRKHSGKAGQPAAQEAGVEIKPEEYEFYLAKAYASADFSKPRDAAGNIKVLPAPEMKKLLYTHVEVTDQDLLQLARHRAYEVRKYLLDNGKFDPERIFVSEPDAIPSVGVDKGKTSAILTLR